MTVEVSRYLTPPQYAEMLGVKPDKILSWIARGELRAIDVSERAGIGRPRWRIPMDAIVEFEQRRSAKPPTKRSRRRGRDQNVLDIIR